MIDVRLVFQKTNLKYDPEAGRKIQESQGNMKFSAHADSIENLIGLLRKQVSRNIDVSGELIFDISTNKKEQEDLDNSIVTNLFEKGEK